MGKAVKEINQFGRFHWIFDNDNSILWLMINCKVFKILISAWGLVELLLPFHYVLQTCEQIGTDD